MASKSKSKIIEELNQQKSELDFKLQEKDGLIQNQEANHKLEIEDLNNKNAELLRIKEEEFNNKRQILDDEIGSLKLRINELESQNEEKQKQLNLQETKKLAKAYEDQKIEYRGKSEIWAKGLLFAAILLTISTGVSIYFSHGKVWHDRFEFYIIDIIFVSAVWFCASQYSYYVKLYSDFTNRQVLAQSYYNIINNTEDTQIKDKFLDKATEVLCSKNGIDHKDNLPVEKILNNTFEITKEALKKL